MALLTASSSLYILYVLYTGLTGPLAHLPGPVWTKFTGLQAAFHIVRGTRMYHLHDLHKKYGPIVRISPTEASVSDPEAAKEIHKARGGYTKTEFYENFCFSPTQTIFSTTDVRYHAKWRKLLAHSVSESNLKTYHSIVQAKVDLLISQMKKERVAQGYVDLLKWLNYYTIDVMGELSFGHSFEMLERGKESQYVKDSRDHVPLNVLRVALTSRSHSDTLNWPFWPFTEIKRAGIRLITDATNCIDAYRKYVAETDSPRPMLLEKVLGLRGQEASVPEAEIVSHAQILMLAGTDTIAITLLYMLWAVYDHREDLTRLLKEIEEANLPTAPDNEEIRKLPYLDNVLTETLRLYGSAPGPLPRRVPKGGRTLCGYHIPEGLTVSPVSYCIHRDESVFPDPQAWNPDRWSNASKEMKEADFSFGGGTRICLGMHLAKMQIRMATVAILREFGDAELAYGVNGFQPEGMRQFDAVAAKPWGEQMLIR
ncbi:cytochrome P450 [Hypomontagnella submonticulosa]|nr:cytochrome P450 [Hypomontagnella submonticulosa]